MQHDMTNKTNNTTSEEDKIIDFSSVEEVRKAFIASEIFTRKY